MVVLNQVDKLEPVGEPPPGPEWEGAAAGATAKGESILEKVRLTARQFGYAEEEVLPLMAKEGCGFNRRQLACRLASKVAREGAVPTESGPGGGR
jgi:hypothetical protein